jgi:hypothetical protein
LEGDAEDVNEHFDYQRRYLLLLLCQCLIFQITSGSDLRCVL